MEKDENVWVLGEDVGRGGIFGQYKGLAATWGPDRVIDTPISEANIMGAGVGMALMGMCFGPLGGLASSLFPAEIRYTGSSLAFNLGGILGASLAPYAATWLATHYGLQYVGYYLSVMSAISVVALLMVKRRYGA